MCRALDYHVMNLKRVRIMNIQLGTLKRGEYRELTEKDIRHYMELVDVMDKAGSYAFQEHGEMIISSVRGDTDNVIGLPVRDVMKCLNGLGYRA